MSPKKRPVLLHHRIRIFAVLMALALLALAALYAWKLYTLSP